MNLLSSLPKILAVLSKPLKAGCRPENLQIDITTLCNLNCSMCPREALGPGEINKSISLEDYRRIYEAILPNSVNLAANGEPLIHPDFCGIVKFSKTRNKALTITSSNFTLANENILEGLVTSGLDLLKISLDAPTAATYERIRGKDLFDKIIANLDKLNSIKASRPSPTPDVRFDIVILKENLPELSKMVELAGKHGVKTVLFRLLDTTRMSPDDKKALLAGFDSSLAVSELRKAGALAKKLGISTNAEDILADKKYLERNYDPAAKPPEAKKEICLLTWLQLFVDVNGNASPCCSLYPGGEQSEGCVGNIYTDGYEQVWNGPRMRGLRKLFREGKNYTAYRACARCNPMGLKNLLASLKVFPKILKF